MSFRHFALFSWILFRIKGEPGALLELKTLWSVGCWFVGWFCWTSLLISCLKVTVWPDAEKVWGMQAMTMDWVIYHQITKNVQEWVESNDTRPVVQNNQSISNIFEDVWWGDSLDGLILGFIFPQLSKQSITGDVCAALCGPPSFWKRATVHTNMSGSTRPPPPDPHPTSAGTHCTHKELHVQWTLCKCSEMHRPPF